MGNLAQADEPESGRKHGRPPSKTAELRAFYRANADVLPEHEATRILGVVHALLVSNREPKAPPPAVPVRGKHYRDPRALERATIGACDEWMRTELDADPDEMRRHWRESRDFAADVEHRGEVVRKRLARARSALATLTDAKSTTGYSLPSEEAVATLRAPLIGAVAALDVAATQRVSPDLRSGDRQALVATFGSLGSIVLRNAAGEVRPRHLTTRELAMISICLGVGGPWRETARSARPTVREAIRAEAKRISGVKRPE